MKVLALALVVVVAVVALAWADETTQPPELCELVCPKPLPDEVVYFASPERCEDYCQCDPRGAILQHCPIWNQTTGERLYFNPTAKVCDWPEHSGCVNP